MHSILAVFRRELALYFRSPVAYAIAFALLLFLGVLFNGFIAQANAALSFGSGIPADAGFAPNLLTFLMFLIAPLLTMRLLAEESREGTLEVLMTLPMHESSFIIGKFLAAWAYYSVLLLLSLVFYALQSFIGVPDAGVALGAYGGAWLYGGAVLAITLIWSAVTEDQIVAAFLGSATILVLYLAEIAAIWIAGQGSSSLLADFVRELGLQAHFSVTLAQGIVRAEDVVYFICVIIGALFITTRLVETRRWRA
ncbi:MAG: ABC transporter permease [Anaerolineaceae bacterium]|nr:ABC transporter permease [Anaerolineaceae bacterium]MCY4022527.1 ABC transporter permease [Anaerolineaceae bacterium]